jgi:dTMP kinase
MSGRFIVLEGPDGSGTTTHSTALVERLRSRGISALHTFEATDGPIGTFIRGKLREGGIPGNALQLLFTADRAWHVEHVLRPALERGETVICDRYSLSTVIYGTAQGFDRFWLESMNEPFIKPDLMLVALPPFDVCMQRLGKRDKDVIEADDSLQKRVYDLYAEYASMLPAAHVIDTSGNKEEGEAKIDDAIQSLLAS